MHAKTGDSGLTGQRRSRTMSIVTIRPSVTVNATAASRAVGDSTTIPAAPLTSAGRHSRANRGPRSAE